MLTATGVKMSDSEKKKKVNKDTYDISSVKRARCNQEVSGSFTL